METRGPGTASQVAVSEKGFLAHTWNVFSQDIFCGEHGATPQCRTASQFTSRTAQSGFCGLTKNTFFPPSTSRKISRRTASVVSVALLLAERLRRHFKNHEERLARIAVTNLQHLFAALSFWRDVLARTYHRRGSH